ncbi:NlpC/P60 family protein [Spirillospora sp. CA-128828]|uniref:C40 family peptidase n=1 Tax=Spirillospora sp. CA-128828 TaxID=3240033 RepID=UPI003D9455FA
MRKKTTLWILGIFAGSSISLVVVFVMSAVVVLLVISSNAPAGACAPEGEAGALQAKASSKAGDIPRNYLKLYVEAGRRWNIPWNVLAGIGYIETRHGTPAQGVHSGQNYAGAGGPMQFLQATFDGVAIDGDGDRTKSRYQPADAIYSAAKLLKVHIMGIDAKPQELKQRTLTAAEIRRSLYSYNHSWSYVNDVLAQANRYSKGHTVAAANYAGAACSEGMTLGSGSFGQRIANAAAYWARREPNTPHPPSQIRKSVFYSWGGGDFSGPTKGLCCSPGGYDGRDLSGFDCSGLVQHAVYEASDGKVKMYPPASAMWSSGKGVKVPRDQLAPGDLVFFSGLGHVAIYYGEFKGKRWMVEAPETWLAPGVRGYVRFSDFDARSSYVGALRVTPPSGMASKSPDVIHAMARSGAGVVEGAM